MKYVDGFLIVVPADKLDDYRAMAEEGRDVWMKHGALDYKECVGDDLHPQMGGMETLSFPTLTGLAADERLIFAFIVYSSRQHRDEVNAKVMSDPAMSPEKMQDKPMPFDFKRFSFGGFEVLVDI
ncbi:MAG: DUF1428 domain-containing protein [Gemmatimonadetes bacterium]|nr:DUF1428 domain-containing protein [Gemmatimonadota bacterium]MBL0178559.1 DUF1428 domain-containing protein [Gemmatimonadota bacterium]